MTEQTRRATRLVEIERRLRKNPAGLTVRELAAMTVYSMRTIQRDLNVLESELGVPLMEATGRRWRLMPGSAPIGAVRFTLQEARAVYLATRLILRHADERDPDTVSALEKLADALPPALGRHVAEAASQLSRHAANQPHVDVLRALTEAWADSRTVLMTYRSATARAPRTTQLDPYLIEPSATGSAVYVFGLSHLHGEIRTFKVDRIITATLTAQHFAAPDLADLRGQLAQSWGGTVIAEDQFDVTLEFSADVAERVSETAWHPSQRLARLSDGRLRFDVRLPSLLEFVPWVRGWGSAVRVLGPRELRDEIAASARATVLLYS